MVSLFLVYWCRWLSWYVWCRWLSKNRCCSYERVTQRSLRQGCSEFHSYGGTQCVSASTFTRLVIPSWPTDRCFVQGHRPRNQASHDIAMYRLDLVLQHMMKMRSMHAGSRCDAWCSVKPCLIIVLSMHFLFGLPHEYFFIFINWVYWCDLPVLL